MKDSSSTRNPDLIHRERCSPSLQASAYGVRHNTLSADIWRCAEVGLAISLLILSTPLLLFIAVAIKWEDGGPILFRQQRVGRDGQPFTMFKFRSLRQGPHNTYTPWVYTTHIGAILRRYGLDELPQLYHILCGQMSLVGPRPILPEEAEGYDAWQAQRLHVRPGLTGWAQVQGRNALAWHERVALDVAYVQRQSIWLNILILLRTPGAILSSKGVYGIGNFDPDTVAVQTCRSTSSYLKNPI